MSRLSLKPGGEPKTWFLDFQECVNHGDERQRFCVVADVPDEDLTAIRATINEYLDAKETLFSAQPVAVKPSKWKSMWRRQFIWFALGYVIAVAGFWYGWNRVPTVKVAPSTGGVIDELCMRPEIECSTNIHYVQPKASAPHQEREKYSIPHQTYSADGLTYANGFCLSCPGDGWSDQCTPPEFGCIVTEPR